MKSSLPWVCVLAMAHMGQVFAQNGLDLYREGDYIEAAKALRQTPSSDPIADYYMGRMSLYGYGLLKNNQLAFRYFKQSAERGFLPAQQIMARVALFQDRNLEQALVWFKKSAELNDVQAQMYCAAAYLFGLGVKQNSDMARRFYIAAAKQGDSIAQTTLAQHFLESHHSANQSLGMLWLNKALAQNNPEAQVILGELYTSGKSMPRDLNKAKEVVGLAVAQGYPPAFYQMGVIAEMQENWTDAKAWYTKAIAANDVRAEIALSDLYKQDKTPLYDKHVSFLTMLSAAQKGSSDAQKRLSLMYKNGDGVEASEDLAKAWQQKSAQSMQKDQLAAKTKAVRWLTNGKASVFSATDYRLRGILGAWRNPGALKENNYNAPPKMDVLTRASLYKPQFVMANPKTIPINDYYLALVATLPPVSAIAMVFPHYSTPKPADEAYVKTLETQAILGDFSAQFELGQRYQAGVGVTQDLQKAIHYYELAAAQQELKAQYTLALLYLETPAEVKKGINLLEDAAFKGNKNAQYALARIHEQGFHDQIPASSDKALAMYGLAAVNGDGLAQYRLAEIKVREKPVNLSQAAIQKRLEQIKALYQGAVLDGVEEARLPLAFYNAMSPDKAKQNEAFLVATKAANEGNQHAALLLGLMYDRGLGVEMNADEALHWYEKAQDNPVGAFVMGTYLSQGIGLDKDLEKGRLLLKKSADAGFSYAFLNLSVMKQQLHEAFLPELQQAMAQSNSTASLLLADYYLSLANNDEQMKQAHDIYQSLAEKGDKDGQLKLAYLLEHGLGAKVDLEGAEKWYRLSAEQGQPVAQYLLGHYYQLAQQPNYTEAKKWYAKAQSVYAPAAVALGFIYETVEDDYPHAQVAYERAASLGDAVGQFNAGLMYEKGKGINVEFKKASAQYLQAANHGLRQAMVQLAGLYFNGLNGERDEVQGLAFYKKAAALGDRDALYQLGLLSETGVALPLDYPGAVHYYEQSASQGDAKAMLALARIYQYGQGVPKDKAKAVALYTELAALENGFAQYQLAVLNNDSITPAQRTLLLKKAQANGNQQAGQALQWMATKAAATLSFIEPARVVNLSITNEKPADLMYLDALNAWNRGDESVSRLILSRILVQYPDYLLAKRAYEQLCQQVDVFSGVVS
jgi:enhanced entry protein EnhC